MAKFNIGDKVKFKQGMTLKGSGIVERVWNNTAQKDQIYTLRMIDNYAGTLAALEYELELISEQTILTSGRRR